MKSIPCTAKCSINKESKMQDLRGKGITKIALPSEVEELSRQGYELIGMYQNLEGTAIRCEVPNETRPYETYFVDKPGVSAVSYFIMRLDEDSAIKKLNDQLESSEKELRQYKKNFEDAHESLIRMSKHTEQQELVIQSLNEERNKLKKDITSIQEGTFKVEEDLGKVREALGTEKMNQILAGK